MISLHLFAYLFILSIIDLAESYPPAQPAFLCHAFIF